MLLYFLLLLWFWLSSNIYSLKGWFLNTNFKVSLLINPQSIKAQTGNYITSKPNNINRYLLKIYYVIGSVVCAFLYIMSFISLPKSLGISFIIIPILKMRRHRSSFSSLSHQMSNRSGWLEFICLLFYCNLGLVLKPQKIHMYSQVYNDIHNKNPMLQKNN